MAVLLEAYTVIVKIDEIEAKIEGGLELVIEMSSAMNWYDDQLFAHSFMVEADAIRFMQQLQASGLQSSDTADPDLVLFSCEDNSVEPWCEWLKFARYKERLIGWLEGTRPTIAIGPDGWSPHEASKIQFQDPDQFKETYEFVESNDGVETWRHRENGKLVYIGRTSKSASERFRDSTTIVRTNFVDSGQPALTGSVADEVRVAVVDLVDLASEDDQWWQPMFFAGKGFIALGDYAQAREWLENAYALEKETEAITRELFGLCLMSGEGTCAIEFAEAAVALQPDHAQSLGNLAMAYVIGDKMPEARTTIKAALKQDASDDVNHSIAQLIKEIEKGQRPRPNSLNEIVNPPA